MYKIILPICILALLNRQSTAQQELLSASGPLAAFVRTNLIGYPVIHDRKSWIFDPDVAQKRRKTFIPLHGDKGEKLIERLGLGIDGNDEVRLIKQRERDEGHLGGLNAFLP